jgi:hypothetical protein
VLEPAKVFEDRKWPGDWQVEWDDDRGCEVALFRAECARACDAQCRPSIRLLRRGQPRSSLNRCLFFRARRHRGLARRDLGSRWLDTFARALCNLGIDVAQAVALRLCRLAELSALASVKAPFVRL